MGIEPTYAAWEAAVLPLNYARMAGAISQGLCLRPAPRSSSARSSLAMVHWTIAFAFGETLLTH